MPNCRKRHANICLTPADDVKRHKQTPYFDEPQDDNTKQCSEIDRHRLLIADLGHSTWPSSDDNTEIIQWDALAEIQKEQRAAIIMITGASQSHIRRYLQKWKNDSPSDTITKLFPGWDNDSSVANQGSAIAVLWNPSYWEATCFHNEPLDVDAVHRSAFCFKLRRVNTRRVTDDDHLFVVITKFHQGTTESGCQFDDQIRQSAWKCLLNLVNEANTNKWMITGSLATEKLHFAMSLSHVNPLLNPKSLFSRDKTISCVAQGVELAECHNHDKRQILVVTLNGKNLKNNKEERSLNQHSVCHTISTHRPYPPREPPPYRLLNFYSSFMKIIENTRPDGLDSLIPLLYGPTQAQGFADDGTLILSAPTHRECAQKLNFVLGLLYEARCKGVDYRNIDQHKLTDHEFEKALGWLTTKFRREFMTSPTANSRGALRAFLRSSIGDASIAYAVIRHGYATPAALLALIKEITIQRQQAQTQKDQQTTIKTAWSHPDLAATAKQARKDYINGEKIALSIKKKQREYDTLTTWEKRLHEKFHTGLLLRQMIAANRAFGHGQGVDKTLSIEQTKLFWNGYHEG